jgi:hypothetical protein
MRFLLTFLILLAPPGPMRNRRCQIPRRRGSQTLRVPGHHPEQFYQPRLLRRAQQVHDRRVEVGLLSLLRTTEVDAGLIFERALDGPIFQCKYQRLRSGRAVRLSCASRSEILMGRFFIFIIIISIALVLGMAFLVTHF